MIHHEHNVPSFHLSMVISIYLREGLWFSKMIPSVQMRNLWTFDFPFIATLNILSTVSSGGWTPHRCLLHHIYAYQTFAKEFWLAYRLAYHYHVSYWGLSLLPMLIKALLPKHHQKATVGIQRPRPLCFESPHFCFRYNC